MRTAPGMHPPARIWSSPRMSTSDRARSLGREGLVVVQRRRRRRARRVARALTLAATQAVANALQHAGGEGWSSRCRRRDDGVRIEVRDAGQGFDLEGVPDDRLGIRASIIARVAAIGGDRRHRDRRHGTTVRLVWRGWRA